AVLPVGAGIEIERLARPNVQNLVGGDRLEHEWRNVILRPVILIAGGVRQQFADGDLAAAREVGDESRYGIVERKLALLGQQEHGGGSELFADGADTVTNGGQRGRMRFDAGVAISLEAGGCPALPDGAWSAGLRLRRRDRSSEQNEDKNGEQMFMSWPAIHAYSLQEFQETGTVYVLRLIYTAACVEFDVAELRSAGQMRPTAPARASRACGFTIGCM